MEDTCRALSRLLKALALPLLVVLMVLLAVIAALGMYMWALLVGFLNLTQALFPWLPSRRPPKLPTPPRLESFQFAVDTDAPNEPSAA